VIHGVNAGIGSFNALSGRLFVSDSSKIRRGVSALAEIEAREKE
jgi:hypothetical protein